MNSVKDIGASKNNPFKYSDASRRRRKLILTLLGVGALMQFSPHLNAEEKFPARLIRIVVPFAAGGPGDIVARSLSGQVADNLSASVIVDNRAGGDAIPGTQFVAKAPPDGYTILQVTSAQVINMVLRDRAPYDLLRDFAPVIQVGATPLVLVAPANSQIRTMKDLIAYAKSNPSGVTYGSGAVGSVGQLSAELLKQAAGISGVHVPYKGNAAAMQDLIGGRLDFAFLTPAEALPNVTSGRLRALAVTSLKRLESTPDTPTMQELGYANFNPEILYGYMVPRNTPQPIVKQLHAAFAQALANPSVQERLGSLSVIPHTGGPQDFAGSVKIEIDRWDEVAKRANIRLE